MRLSVLMILLAMLVSGCVSQQALVQNETNYKEFNLVIGHTFYSPVTITVNKGDAVRIIALSVPGTGIETYGHNHGFTIDAYNIDVIAASEKSPVIVQFIADKSGIFPIHCNSCFEGPYGADHPDIRGTLVVKDG